MKKILIFSIALLSIVLNVNYVSAKNGTYMNSKGVNMTLEEYNDLSKIYSKDYIEFVSESTFNEIKNYKTNDLIIKDGNDLIQPLSGSYTTNYKSIKIIKNGTHITLLLTWLKLPATRSYDVFGIRFDGPALNGGVVFQQVYDVDETLKAGYTHYLQTFSNGFGTSFLLPSSTFTSLQASIDFNISGSGRIYGTYQHAQKKVTLANSKNYTISNLGYGKVLKFSSSVKENYDAMSGVYLDV